ncbi:MAG: extracellular solute-binding protein [Subdoligranulum sp.]|nr:extracellular solute-binding protein [Subdoligranulum sp.]
MKKMRWAKVISLFLVAAMLFCACGTPPEDASGAVNSTAEPAATDDTVSYPEYSGTVTFAVRDNVLEQTKLALREFKKLYPNIQVEIQEFSSSSDLYTYLTTQSTAQNMPDVVLGWDNLSAFALQNWLYPLNEFLEADSETQYINQELLDGFTYEGKTYAVPSYLLFSCVVVNLDLLDELNLDRPGYDWTMEEFSALAKAAATTSTSGINHLESLNQYLMMELLSEGGQWGYHPDTKTFDLSGGAFEQAQSFVEELRKVPQLVADDMRDTTVTANGGMDDYAKKFGANVDALAEGKVLIANQSTWDDSWLAPSLEGINWDYYPIPCASPESAKQIIHADYGMMLSTAKDPEAAFQLLKFFTYGRDGLLVRMALQDENANGLYANNRFTVPASAHPDVAAMFENTVNTPDGVKYMYAHMDSAVKGDYSKVLPDYWKIVNDNIYQATERIKAGEDAASVCRETEEKVNADFAESYAIFSEQMQQVQKDFEEMRGQ